MDAQIFVEGDVSGLLERADQVACLEHRSQHRSRIARISAQIAVQQLGGKEWRTSGNIEHDVAG